MLTIEELLEKAYKNNKTITYEDIVNNTINEEEYNNIIDILNRKGIDVFFDYKEENNDYGDFTNNLVTQYLKDASAYPLLTLEKERELFLEYEKTHSEEIRKKIINSNLKLVVSIAKMNIRKQQSSSLDFLDLVQEGNKGLMKAVEKYDVAKGYKFSTYAYWWIKREMDYGIITTGRTIRLPNHLVNNCKKIEKYIATKKVFGENVSVEELSSVFKMSKTTIKNILDNIDNNVISLNEKEGGQNKYERIEYLESNELNIEDKVEEKVYAQELLKTIKETLNERECFILSCKYGLVNEFNDNPEPSTFEAIGKNLGISRQRTKMIEERALKKLRPVFKQKMYK